MAAKTDAFRFEDFEKLKKDQVQKAKEFLIRKFPNGSDAHLAVSHLTNGRAECLFGEDHGFFYICIYTRPGHGLMALVSSIEWRVVIETDRDGRIIRDIAVGRNSVGP